MSRVTLRSPRQRLMAGLAGLRFRWFQRHRHEQVTVEQLWGKPLIVLPGVLNPVLFRSGQFMAEALNQTLVPTQSAVLDLGTGSGIGALFAAQWAARVVATDVNPMALRCARLNVILHGLESCVVVREGDLFAPVAGERFDVVLFNPPYFHGEPANDFERALYSNDIALRFAASLSMHLSPNGHALLLLASSGQQAPFLTALHRNAMTTEIIRQKKLPYETLYLYKITR